MEAINIDKSVDEVWGFYVDIESGNINNNDNYKSMIAKYGVKNCTISLTMDDIHGENETNVNISGCNFCCSKLITLLLCSYFVFYIM